MLSAIQIRNHRFTEIQLIPTAKLPADQLAERRITGRHSFILQQKKGDSRFWRARLRVELVHPEDGTQSIYTGVFELIGEFEIHEACPEADRQNLAALNGGAILYGAVRECMCSLSARSLHGMIELPTIDARCFVEQFNASKKQRQTKPKE